jgi:hypothetical protein
MHGNACLAHVIACSILDAVQRASLSLGLYNEPEKL